MERKSYPTDLTNKQWKILKPFIPPEKPGGRPRSTDTREITNAIMYQLHTGCQWDCLPHDFPPRTTVNGYFMEWIRDGALNDMLNELVKQVRLKEGRNATPTAGIVDSQTAKNAGPAEEVGYDAGKKIKGRKRHILVDILGLLLGVYVHSAGIQERAGAKLLLSRVMHLFPGIQIIWADGGYTGHKIVDWVMQFFGVVWKVIKRPRKVFQIVKFRWVVERTFGWMNYHRRLSKDYEYTTASAEAWIKLAAIRMMLKRLEPG